MNNKLIAAVLLLLAMTCARGQESTSKYSVLVWGKGCITNIQLGDKTRLEAPLVNGRPDMREAKVYNAVVTYSPECGHIEIRNKMVRSQNQ